MKATTVGRTLEWARRRAGMSQQDLAGAVGMPQPSIARIETGAVVPRAATLIELLQATGHRLTVEPVDPPVDREAIGRRLAMKVPQRTLDALGRRNTRSQTGPIRTLRRLRRFNVPFVLIGELAEVVHGAPMSVRTIEVCHATTDVARQRLAMALDDGRGRAIYAGRVRLVTETAAGDAYDVLARTASKTLVDAGLLVPVAALEDLIRIRVAGCSPEDREAAAVLRAIHDMRPPSETRPPVRRSP